MPQSDFNTNSSRLPAIVTEHRAEILAAWLKEQLAAATFRADRMDEAELRQQSAAFLSELANALRNGALADFSGPSAEALQSLLAQISRTRATQGFTPIEIATFILSVRPILTEELQRAYGSDLTSLFEESRLFNLLLDRLALVTTEAAVGVRDEMIRRQQEEMIELSTPVVRLFPGILGLPLIGTLDSARTQVVMENLLQSIVDTGCTIAIIDITGVPTVDTLVAQHLMKTVAATRLMGAECIISGIRPQIAQTIVHLGVDLQRIATKATLADALELALQKLGLVVVKKATA